MTQDEIIEMARQAGFSGSVAKMWVAHFEAFAKLVAAKEREACAKVCEDLHPGLANLVAAQYIRARGEQA